MLIDTNILIYAINADSPKHEKAKLFITSHRQNLMVAQQNIFEALRVLTHKKFSHPMTVAAAQKALLAIVDVGFVISPNGKTQHLALAFINEHNLTGNRIFDAYLTATALSNGVTTIATDNVKDFKKFTITVLNPFQNLYNRNMGYTKDAIKGISWIAVLRGSTRGISFVKTIILARILVPAQFGAYGVALLVLGFLEVMTETGVNVLLIQEKEINKYINSAWLVSILRGVIIAVVIILLTPFIAAFFHSPESAILLYTISLVPFIRGFINPAVVKFQKELTFQKEFWYRFAAFSIDAFVGIIVTVITKHPIGIVIGLIAGVLVELILSYLIVKPTPFLAIDREYIMKIIHRGKWVTMGGIFNYLFHNADKIIVGRILGATPLGVYQMAYSFSMLPITEIADVFARVTFPVYTKIAGDLSRLLRAFIKTTLVIAGLTVPFGVLLIVFPKEIVLFILGDQWLAVVPLLPVLGIFAIIRTISGSSSALFLAVGKQEYITVVTFASIAGLLISIFPLINIFGIVGAAFSAVVGSLVAVPFYVYYSLKVFQKR